jgi:hypothetical protein
MPSPLSSGTAFLAVNGWLTAFGEEGGWKYMDALHENITQYGHSGSAPCRQAAAGETVIGISYSTPGVKAINDGAPIKIILPEEGLGWEIEATALIKGAKNTDDARKLADWVSSREAAQISSKFLPITAYDDISELPPNYPEGEKEKLLKMDFASLAANREAVIFDLQTHRRANLAGRSDVCRRGRKRSAIVMHHHCGWDFAILADRGFAVFPDHSLLISDEERASPAGIWQIRVTRRMEPDERIPILGNQKCRAVLGIDRASCGGWGDCEPTQQGGLPYEGNPV